MRSKKQLLKEINRLATKQPDNTWLLRWRFKKDERYYFQRLSALLVQLYEIKEVL